MNYQNNSKVSNLLIWHKYHLIQFENLYVHLVFLFISYYYLFVNDYPYT